ncbi:Aste57867_23275 [Aphanomyces stellatus]|uniref:Aste57867_23275 protein n=1 Tax=Aphanomyces stellatus TaxID=120398 RepID=A0A485LMP9_9STRA|nr:hypothetical protein As57867_023204 [Aphanomyces stellatus]VFT99920.1 Aste57867_23275 [Aphanomyces stellatus]
MKEGYLQKQGQLLKGWKKRWFVCDGRSLNYFHTKLEKTPNAIIPLETMTVQDGGMSERWSAPKMYVTDGLSGVVYCLSSEDSTVTLQWLQVLRHAVQRAHDKRDAAASTTPTRMKSHSVPLDDNASLPSPRRPAAASVSDLKTPPSSSSSSSLPPKTKSAHQLATTIRLENDLATASERLNALLLHKPSSRTHFQFHGVHDGVRVSTGVDAPSGNAYARGSIVVDVVPAIALRVLLDHSKRHEWDVHFPQSSHVASYGGATDLVYLSGGAPAAFVASFHPVVLGALPAALFAALWCGVVLSSSGSVVLDAAAGAILGAALGGVAALLFSTDALWRRVVAPRDVVLLRHVYEANTSPGDGGHANAMIVAELSVANELKPPLATVVRANVGVSGWLVQSLGTESTLLTHVVDVTLGGWLPAPINDRVRRQRVLALAAIAEYVKQAKIYGPHLGYDDRAHDDDADGLVAMHDDDDDDLDSFGSDSAMVAPAADAASRGGFHPRDYMRSVVRAPTGGVTLTDKEVAKKQNGVVMEVIKSMGSKLLDGKSAVSLSLPVRIFEPRTMLDRLVDFYLYAPNYLSAANDATDMVERFKLTMAFAVAGWHHNIGCAKPFNPIVGETLEAELVDGATVHCEQASSNPSPISYAQIVHPKYSVSSYTVVNGSMQTNSIVQVLQGPVKVSFEDGSSIEFTLPSLRMSGMLWGERVMEVFGTISFHDKTHGLACDLRLNPDEHKGLFASNKAPTDYFRGTLKAADNDVCAVSGSWLDELKFGDKVYWSLDRDACAPLVRLPDDKVLPSDSRNRPDLRALAVNDLDEAQERKYEVEKLQRVDRAHRKDGRRPNHWTLAAGGH